MLNYKGRLPDRKIYFKKGTTIMAERKRNRGRGEEREKKSKGKRD